MGQVRLEGYKAAGIISVDWIDVSQCRRGRDQQWELLPTWNMMCRSPKLTEIMHPSRGPNNLVTRYVWAGIVITYHK